MSLLDEYDAMIKEAEEQEKAKKREAWDEFHRRLTELPNSNPYTHEPPPKPGKVVVLDLVLKDLQDRAEMGKEKYGTYLMTHNGRNTLMDAYQEALDLVMYLRQALYEQEGK